MVIEQFLAFGVGFVVLVGASYLGTTMALRGFFGRRYVDPERGSFTSSERDRYRDGPED